MRPFFSSLLLASCALSVSGGPASFPITWPTFPKGTPATTYPDGPFLGNGNIGVTIGGSPGSVTLYVTVNGFWGVSYNYNSSMPPLTASGDFEEPQQQQQQQQQLPSPPLSFPGCPAENCTIPVGLTLAGLTLSSPCLNESWTSTQSLSGASASVVLASGSASLTIDVLVSATEQVVVVGLTSNGPGAITDLNVSLWANGNVANVPISAGSKASSAPSDAYVLKDANPPATSPFPITGAMVSTWYALDPSIVFSSAALTPYAARVPAKTWVNGSIIETLTVGLTQMISIFPGGGAQATLLLSAAASNDPGVPPQTPLAVCQARVANVTNLTGLEAAHAAWWADYWSHSSIELDEAENETAAYWYTAIYALGSASRAGQVVADLWSPWRTTDYSSWRSNPTLDYNQQALYSGVYTANHVELAQPYYDFIAQALASGSPQAEAASLGCSAPAVHFSVDLGPFGLKLGQFGVPANWGIFSNAAYAAVNFAYHWQVSSPRAPATLTWISDYACPFLTAVASFWECRLVKTPVPSSAGSYEYWDVFDCTGDEGCSVPAGQRTNPMWGVVYIRRLFATLVEMGDAGLCPCPAAWRDIASHLPPIPTTLHDGEPILAWYGNGSTYLNLPGQANNLHALWPGEVISLSEPNATLQAAAQNAFNFTSWTQSNSFSWIFAAATRAGVPPDTVFRRWHQSLAISARTNRLMAYGGLCSDSLGGIAFLHDALLQSQEGFLRLFAGWQGNLSAAFTTLRARGALLVSAAYVGAPQYAGRVAATTGAVQNVTIFLEALQGDTPQVVRVLSPWPQAAPSNVTVLDLGTRVPSTLTWSMVQGVMGGPLFSFNGTGGHTYLITKV